MTQERVREEVERAFVIEVKPTPSIASNNKTLRVDQAAEEAVEAANASFRSLEISRTNIQTQIASIRDAVSMSIMALSNDDRYLDLLEAEELWGIKLDVPRKLELEMFRMMDYKELTSDERRELISIRDMGYERFNLNIKKIDFNTEIMRNQLKYAAIAQYAGVAKMQSAITLQQEALDLQLLNLEILRSKYELGAASRIELENAELSYEKTRIELDKQRRSLTSLLTGFNRLVGENLATTYEDFDKAQFVPPESYDPVDKYIGDALANRSEILLAEAEMSLALRQAALYETEITHYDTLADKQDAIQAAEESEITRDLAYQDVRAEIQNAYKQLTALRGVTAYYESQIETAKLNYERTQALYELGMTTAAGVEQVRMSYIQAQMQLDNNTIDIWLQVRKLEIISGIGPGNL